MPNSQPPATVDAIDGSILAALADDPRATVLAIADRTQLSRNTVQARLSKLEQRGVLRSFERSIDPAALGYPLTAFILTNVTQSQLTPIASALGDVPEVVEVHGSAGSATCSCMSSLAMRTICIESPARFSTSPGSRGRPPRS